MFVRAYALHPRARAAEGLAQPAELAVLNANYVRALLEDVYHLPTTTDSLHEVVFTDKTLKRDRRHHPWTSPSG